MFSPSQSVNNQLTLVLSATILNGVLIELECSNLVSTITGIKSSVAQVHFSSINPNWNIVNCSERALKIIVDS